MNLYLVQHGKAASKDEDPNRGLSDEGKREMSRIVEFLGRRRIVSVKTIYHSGKARAEQTAEMLADAIKPENGLEKSDGLAPMDDPSIWAGKLAEMYEDVMLVGHLPYMSRMASLLLVGDPSTGPVHVRNGGIICLIRTPDNIWSLDWVVTPAILP